MRPRRASLYLHPTSVAKETGQYAETFLARAITPFGHADAKSGTAGGLITRKPRAGE